MSNRSLSEVRRRGESPIDFRDFQRKVVTPQAPVPPPFKESAPSIRPYSPFEQTRQPPRTRSPVPSLPRGLGKFVGALARRFPLVVAAAGAYELYRQFKGQAAVPGNPLPTADYSQWYTKVPCGDFGASYDGNYCGGFPACLPLQAGPCGQADGAPVQAGWGDFGTWQQQTLFPNRWATRHLWVRHSPGAGDPIPANTPTIPYKPLIVQDPLKYNDPFPTPAPLPYPALQPETIPIAQPAPTPQPIPFRMLPHFNPNGRTVIGSERGYAPAQERALDLSGASYKVDARTAYTPGPLAQTQPAHRFKPPGAGVKERKAKISSAARVTLKVVNEYTEGLDLLDIFYDALPEEFKKLPKHKGLRNMRPQHKLEVLYRHWDKVSLKEVVKNWIENEVEDRAFGTIGKHIGKLGRQSDRPVGYESGGSLGKTPKGFNPGPSPWKDWMDIVWP